MSRTSDSATRPPFTVCVYCGSRFGLDPAFKTAAADVGRLIGNYGWQLVYGGGNVGLMGVVADAALAAGAHVTGVIPQTLMQREVGHPHLQEMHVVDTMHQRKHLMADRADAFLALPGGIGTLEELYEVWTWRQLGYHNKPIGLLNTAGYYDPLLAFMERSVAQGFLNTHQMSFVQTAAEPEALLKQLHAIALDSTSAEDYGRI